MSNLKIGVLLSGSGTNLQAIIDAVRDDDLPVEIVHVVSSRPDAYGIKRAEEAGIPVTVMNRSMYEDPCAADAHIVEALRDAGAEYVVMAGYMRKVTPVMLSAFPDRVLNLHPALLPSFVGAHAIDDAYNAGVKVTGVTVHLANEEYDKGPIVAPGSGAHRGRHVAGRAGDRHTCRRARALPARPAPDRRRPRDHRRRPPRAYRNSRRVPYTHVSDFRHANGAHRLAKSLAGSSDSTRSYGKRRMRKRLHNSGGDRDPEFQKSRIPPAECTTP